MPFAILDSNKVENWKSLRKLNQATCARDCFRVLRDEELFTYENVIFVQYLLKTTHCEELYTQCVEYAKTQKALCFYEAPTGNLYENPVDMTNCKALLRYFSQQSDNVYLLSVFSKFLIIQSKRICFLNTLYLQISSVYLQSIRSSAIYNLVTTNILKYIYFFFIENGYKNVKFHVGGNLSDYTTEDIQKIKETVAVILKCTEDDIIMSGIYQATSFFVVISIKQEYKRKLISMVTSDKEKLIGLNIDYFIVDFKTVYLGIPKVKYFWNKLFICSLQTDKTLSTCKKIRALLFSVNRIVSEHHF